MKRIVPILGVVALLSAACSNDEANTGQRAESEWNNYIQKHLIGEWKPISICIKPLVGETLLKEEYSSMGKPNDVVRLDTDFTGVFTREDESNTSKTTTFTWYHKLEELGLVLPNHPVFKAVIIHKSQEELEVALPLEQVMPFFNLELQERINRDLEAQGELLAVFRFVK
ncbi:MULTISPECIES: hypothetical protein [unclassified Myroides]|uniref:hypothetical protein n=1 Tax=unclassified Myroides TaxID=2642485 RepID=UPI003D2F51F5